MIIVPGRKARINTRVAKVLNVMGTLLCNLALVKRRVPRRGDLFEQFVRARETGRE